MNLLILYNVNISYIPYHNYYKRKSVSVTSMYRFGDVKSIVFMQKRVNVEFTLTF